MPLWVDGTIKAGLGPGSLSDVTCEFRSFRLVQSLRSVAVPITPDSPREEYRRGAVSQAVQVEFRNIESRVMQMLAFNAQTNDSTAGGRKPGEIYMTFVEYDGSVSGSNPEWGGWVLPEAVSVGGAVMALDQQTQTWRARDWTTL